MSEQKRKIARKIDLDYILGSRKIVDERNNAFFDLLRKNENMNKQRMRPGVYNSYDRDAVRYQKKFFDEQKEALELKKRKASTKLRQQRRLEQMKAGVPIRTNVY
tara:strand:- start:313 stop:627 length:315 start_codon:yes stop_codon:yes gene_type:complete